MGRKRSTSSEYEKLIFEMHYHRVYQTAYYIVKDIHLAQDVVQETFIKAFNRIDTLTDGEKMGAWLGTIATRTAIDIFRKNKKRIDIPSEDVYINEKNHDVDHSIVESAVEYELLKKEIKESLLQLEPAEYREIIYLRYYYDLSIKELAENLGLTEGAVKSRLYRARIRLKKLLNEQFGEKEVE